MATEPSSHVRTWGRWSGSHPGHLSVKVHWLTRSDQCWRVTSSALAHKNVIGVNAVSFLNYAFVSSLDQASWSGWHDDKYEQISQTFHSWIFLLNTWMDLQWGTEMPCWQICGVQFNLILEQPVVVTSTGVFLSSPCQQEGEPGKPVRNVAALWNFM